MTETRKNLNPEADRIAMVSFDVWLTLIKSNPLFKPARNKMMQQKLGISGVSERDFNDMLRFTDRGADSVSDATGRQIGFEERVVLTAQCFGRTAVAAEVLASIRASQQEIMQQHTPLLMDERIPERLSAIHTSGKQVALISNTGFIDGEDMRVAFDVLGIQDSFDHQIFSNEAQVAKPNSEIFRKLIVASGIEAPHIVHMGDNPVADIQGAQAVGMQTRLVNTGELTVVEAIDGIL